MKIAVFVDVQNDFITGALRNDKAIAVLPEIIRFAEKCVGEGYKIYATRDTHDKTAYKTLAVGEDQAAKEIPCEGYLASLEGKRLPVEHCIRETSGWQIADGLMDKLVGNCTFVDKPTFGSFDLVEIVEEDLGGKVDEIVICGFCTSICVLANAVLLRARFPNAKISVASNLCACVTAESHETALKAIAMQQIDVIEA